MPPSIKKRGGPALPTRPAATGTELLRALEGVTFQDAFHVTFASGRPAAGGERTYYLCHPRRRAWRTAVNAVQALIVLLKERPDLVVSTGADVAVPIFILGKLMRARTIFVETAGSLSPSLAGRLAYPFADLFIVQWPEKRHAFPRAVMARGLLL